MSKNSRDENAIGYAVALLHDSGLEVNVDNLNKVLAAAGVEVETYWPMLMAGMANSRNLDEVITGDDGAKEEEAEAEAEAAPEAKKGGNDGY